MLPGSPRPQPYGPTESRDEYTTAYNRLSNEVQGLRVFLDGANLEIAHLRRENHQLADQVRERQQRINDAEATILALRHTAETLKVREEALKVQIAQLQLSLDAAELLVKQHNRARRRSVGAN